MCVVLQRFSGCVVFHFGGVICTKMAEMLWVCVEWARAQ